MKISSSYYNYYNQLYPTNSISNQNTGSEDSDSPQDVVDTISSSSSKNTQFQESGSINDLEFSPRKMHHHMRKQDVDTSNSSDSVNKVKADIDAIKTADIDNMSADDLKTTLTNLVTDMNNVPQHKPETKSADAFNKIKSDMDSIKKADISSMSADDVKNTLTNLISDFNSVRRPHGGYNNAPQLNLDNMSESDMRDMLQKIQDNANKVPEQDEPGSSTDLFSSTQQDINSMTESDMREMLKKIQDEDLIGA